MPLLWIVMIATLALLFACRAGRGLSSLGSARICDALVGAGFAISLPSSLALESSTITKRRRYGLIPHRSSVWAVLSATTQWWSCRHSALKLCLDDSD